ncbi:mannitol dehydrogenase family protein [uncultured Hyphomonas sp.]|jgi:fructuronate reductase|uniref:mannitol dehydrogenase family protein n=1 Tax=uncultured Hyphomonas sp. TaxID=225298 RepID=UPI000C687F09|nr:mannitol dehydrogenase [Hyphomonadaceae bacterium]MBA29012.1 mannitol dehydrogenase [Hyphomonadaceae bacterium]|tara:strand:+ start:29675 stop:31168 length:1494 start_codon:yes stop_codon:yes gene_type:complete
MRLSLAAIGQLPEGIAEPGYDPTAYGVGIVHMGIGAFHRCHMAVYTDDVLANTGGDWRILGVSLRSSKIRDQLEPQDGLYTVIVRGASGDDAQVIGSVAGVLWAPDDPQRVLEAMSAASTKIISLTITEKGYCLDPATGSLNQAHPDIQHDLVNLGAPKSAIGYLVAALARRRDSGTGPVTILCCDNLSSNGKVVERIVQEFAQQVDSDLAEWIRENVAFPSTMVDRIVPAVEAEQVQAFAEQYGIEDAAVLQTEPFSQWVIEDSFAAGRPPWETTGATLVEDVAPFEDAKLRMLNGAHSALAYIGYLSGYEFVHVAMKDKKIQEFVDYLMRMEAAKSLSPTEGFDLDAYRLDLQRRFDNPSLRHRTYQIAMDGSQKIPQRFLGTVRTQLTNGGSIRACCFGIAAWMRYISGRSEQGEDYIVQDPLAERLSAVAHEYGHDPVALTVKLLGFSEIFATDLPQNPEFVNEVKHWVTSISREGMQHALAEFVKDVCEAKQ